MRPALLNKLTILRIFFVEVVPRDYHLAQIGRQIPVHIFDTLAVENRCFFVCCVDMGESPSVADGLMRVVL